MFGYGLWRSDDSGTTWTQIFHTVNQTDFDDPDNPGDTIGDRTEFDLVDLGATTRAYLGDESDDLTLDPGGRRRRPGARVPQRRRRRHRRRPAGAFDNTGWTELSSDDPASNGFAAYGFCQTQCSYDMFVASPPGKPNEVWLGGSMNYDELPAYAGQPPRSNGRAVIRSHRRHRHGRHRAVAGHDAEQASDDAWDPAAGLHPDQHAIGFSADGAAAFVASDGGVARVGVAVRPRTTRRRATSASTSMTRTRGPSR